MNAHLEVHGVAHAMAVVLSEIGEATREGLARAGEIVAEEARQNHEYKDRTFWLTRSIASDDPVGNFFGGTLECEVGADAPHAAAIEVGSRAHVIRARNAKMLRFTGRDGRLHFRKQVNHPGTKAYRYLAGSLEREADAVAEAVIDGALEAFEAAGFDVER